MSRYIDADALKIDYGFTWDDIVPTHEEMYALIDRQKTADVRENVRGKWIKSEEAWRNGIRIRIRRCSNCCGAKPLQAFGAEDEEFKYCPWCGAHMVMGDE